MFNSQRFDTDNGWDTEYPIEQGENEKQICPYCNGTTLNLSHPDDGGTCPHCFGGYVDAA